MPHPRVTFTDDSLYLPGILIDFLEIKVSYFQMLLIYGYFSIRSYSFVY